MPARRHQKPEWSRYAGLGIELAAAVAGLTVMGWWLDRQFGSDPWGLLVGLALGLVGGLYNFVRDALRAIQASSPANRGNDDGERDHD